MAIRLMASQAFRALRCRAFRRHFYVSSHLQAQFVARDHPFRQEGQRSSFLGQARAMSTSIAKLPEIADSDILQALKSLLAVNWSEIPEEAEEVVEAALSKKTDDTAGLEKLKMVVRAAQAVEKFSGTLIAIRMALDDLTGISGEKVRPLPPVLAEALKAALSRYNTYLASFNEDEYYLRKKVEVELGSLLVHLRQRCSGLGPEWSTISLIGTSGLSGSFVELRAADDRSSQGTVAHQA